MAKEYYCPYCKMKLEDLGGWGSMTYYCKDCKEVISKYEALDKKEIDTAKKKE